MVIKKMKLEELTKKDIFEILSLYKEYNEQTVARILNISPPLVSQIVTNYILAQRGVSYIKSYLSFYLFELGYDIEEISRRLKVKTNSVFAFIKEPFIKKISSPLFYKMLKIAWREQRKQY
jgi:hypothetical protein